MHSFYPRVTLLFFNNLLANFIQRISFKLFGFYLLALNLMRLTIHDNDLMSYFYYILTLLKSPNFNDFFYLKLLKNSKDEDAFYGHFIYRYSTVNYRSNNYYEYWFVGDCLFVQLS